jgi:hypothetical protein
MVRRHQAWQAVAGDSLARFATGQAATRSYGSAAAKLESEDGLTVPTCPLDIDTL